MLKVYTSAQVISGVVWLTMSSRVRAAAGAGCVALVLCGAGMLLFYRLGAEPLQDYDEAAYALIARESAQTHTLPSPIFLGRPFLEKPPLLIWLIAGAAALGASPEETARLPSALAGLALVAVVMGLAYEATRSVFASAFSGAVLATTPAFIEAARQSRTDILVALFITLALYGFVRGMRRPIWMLFFGAALGLAAMSKSVIAVFALLAALAHLLFSRRFDLLRTPQFWGGVAAFFLIAAPWHIYETLRFGGSFWSEYIGRQVLERAAQPFFAQAPTNADYVSYLFNFAAPWSEALCVSALAAPLIWKRMWGGERALFTACALTIASILGVFFIAQTKAYSYLLPLYPFMALAVALAGAALMRALPRVSRAAAAIFGLMLVGTGLKFSIYDGFHINPYYAYEVEMAREEKAVGTYLAAHPGTLYVFDDTYLGSVMFYSGDTYPLALLSGMSPEKGSFVLTTPGAAPLLLREHPANSLHPVYSGGQNALFEVL